MSARQLENIYWWNLITICSWLVDKVGILLMQEMLAITVPDELNISRGPMAGRGEEVSRPRQ